MPWWQVNVCHPHVQSDVMHQTRSIRKMRLWPVQSDPVHDGAPGTSHSCTSNTESCGSPAFHCNSYIHYNNIYIWYKMWCPRLGLLHRWLSWNNLKVLLDSLVYWRKIRSMDWLKAKTNYSRTKRNKQRARVTEGSTPSSKCSKPPPSFRMRIWAFEAASLIEFQLVGWRATLKDLHMHLVLISISPSETILLTLCVVQ